MKPWKLVMLTLFGVAVVAACIAAGLIVRGFSATRAPSTLETAVARRIRNFSISRREKNAKNPFIGDPAALREGREEFLAQCAGCHGVDGSGRTAIGSNEYPRVPDLRQAPTQELSDGTLHAIITSGVALTGMPAWSNPHHGPSSDSWKLVLFVRSLAQMTPAESSRQSAELAHATYVGSQACERCHQEIYRNWKKTPMANVVRDPHTVTLPDMNANHVLKFTPESIAFVYGSIWKQRYFTKVGDDYYPLPVQWDIKTQQWMKYMVPSNGADWWGSLYPPDNMQRPTGPLCDGCHSVGYDIRRKHVAEWNVGCERCHGPGSEHVAHATRQNIVNPGRMDAVANSDTCIQCHSQGQPLQNPIEGKYYDWPVGYEVGLQLQNFWKLETCTFGETTFYYFPDCTAHKNRMQGNDFAQSVMYRRGVTCASCHDVHGTGNYAQLRKPAEQLCLDCHGPQSPNGPHTATLEAHTHHAAGSTGSECVACHMPAIESEGVPGAMVHAHTFRFISPAMTDRYKIPNPCTECHKDKSTAWAEGELRRWPEYSSWRME